MAFRPLGSKAKTILSKSSPSGLARVFSGLGPNLASSRWLDTSNPYPANCVKQIDDDLASGGVDQVHLAQYIAASVPLHCADGWTFLARALSSYCNGNPHQAAHFAYYAELRAAMSILASRGIGIFNNKHFVVDGSGNIQGPVSGSTHTFTWGALDFWAGTSNSGIALLDLFIIAGTSANDWFNAIPGSAVASSLASEWLRKWGLDLSIIDDDHDMRNLSSYRPNEFAAWDTDARECSNFLCSMWSLFEPAANRFETLDKHLLRTLVRKTILAVGPTDPAANVQAQRLVSEMLNGLSIGDAERDVYRSFLLSPGPEPSLLVMAQDAGTPTDRHTHERVMARAALLLRVASGFTAQLVDTATFAMRDIQFWTSPWGDRRAFWAPDEAPDDLRDLWSDVDVAIGEEKQWITDQGSAPLSMNRWRLGREETMRPLTECDRVSLWALQR